MANQEHLDILKQGVKAWNKWREEHPEIQPDLSETMLSFANLSNVNLSNANLSFAYLKAAKLSGANLSGANLSGADLTGADLSGTDLSGTDLQNAGLNDAILNYANLNRANLSNTNLSNVNLSNANLSFAYLKAANLSGANLSSADLSRTDLSGANLERTILVGTNLTNSKLKDCTIYGITVWDVQLDGAEQLNLRITPDDQDAIMVDNLKIAQFISLILNNKTILEIVDTISSKMVLILGRFTEERKLVLDALRNELRKRNYIPVLFDFEKPASRDLTETISVLAHLSRFILVDLTDPSSAPHEITTIIPQTDVPVQPLLTFQPLLVEGKVVERREYAMFEDLKSRYSWVLPTFRFQDTADLLASFQEHIIEPAEQKVQELAK